MGQRKHYIATAVYVIIAILVGSRSLFMIVNDFHLKIYGEIFPVLNTIVLFGANLLPVACSLAIIGVMLISGWAEPGGFISASALTVLAVFVVVFLLSLVEIFARSPIGSFVTDKWSAVTGLAALYVPLTLYLIHHYLAFRGNRALVRE